MAATVREAIRELLEQTIATMESLLDASDRELPLSSSHACAQGKDLWTLITNDIDHEKIHTGQVLEGRYESRITASPMQRLIAEWLAERARLVGSLVGLTDAQFNAETAPGQWTYRGIAKHVLSLEQDAYRQAAHRQQGHGHRRREQHRAGRIEHEIARRARGQRLARHVAGPQGSGARTRQRDDRVGERNQGRVAKLGRRPLH